jgi:hypothetical protein
VSRSVWGPNRLIAGAGQIIDRSTRSISSFHLVLHGISGPIQRSPESISTSSLSLHRGAMEVRRKQNMSPSGKTTSMFIYVYTSISGAMASNKIMKFSPKLVTIASHRSSSVQRCHNPSKTASHTQTNRTSRSRHHCPTLPQERSIH